MAGQITNNIASHLSSMAEKQPWRQAVVFPHARDSQGRVSYTHYTFLQLEQASNQIASGLVRAGIKRGMRTALMAPPSLDFFALTFALFKLGAVPVLIDPGIGLSSLGKGLSEAEPEAFIGIPKAHFARILFGWARKTISIKIVVGDNSLLGDRTLNEIKRLGLRDPFEPVIPEPGEIAAILFTSGSTGPSKGVVYTHEYFTEQVKQLKQIYGIEPGEIDLPTFPLFSLFGPALGMTAILPDMDPTRPANVDPAKILEAANNFGVTEMFGSPALLNRVGRYGQEHNVHFPPSLRRVISAGAPASVKILERFCAMLPPGVQVFTPYGATECLPVASIGSNVILKETRFQTDIGKGVCVGFPVPELTVKIIRITDSPIEQWSDALVLPRGVIGEITVKGPHATRYYYHQPEATALAKIPEEKGAGFYHRMGDVGYLDESGRIWFCGRKAHRVVTPTSTFFTIPCEAVFNTHPAVYRSALVGVKRNGATEPAICIELEPGTDKSNLAKIREELLAIGAKYPHTAPIKTLFFHPAFPVDIRHNAKIFREKLTIWAQQQI